MVHADISYSDPERHAVSEVCLTGCLPGSTACPFSIRVHGFLAEGSVIDFALPEDRYVGFTTRDGYTVKAKLKRAKPAGFARFLRQPHKIDQINWNECRFEGDVILLSTGAGEANEAYQMCSVRAGPSDEWTSARWKLVKACRAAHVTRHESAPRRAARRWCTAP